MPSPARRDDRPLAASLLRPFIDLEPCQRGPLCARGLEQYWLAFVDTRRPRFVPQRLLPRAFRALLLQEVGLPEYDVDDPRALPSGLRSARWQAVCEALEAWPDLTADHQCRLILLLHGLCFYPLIGNRLDLPDARITSGEDARELVYWRASARYLLGLPDRVADYGEADLSTFERIVSVAPPHEAVAFNAALKILIHKGKVGAPVDELVAWRARSERILDAVLGKSDAFTHALLVSRFYRAAAFVPQRRGDRREVVRLMDLAEHHAHAMAPTDPAQEFLYLENLHPVLQSRAKEALWLGDLDLALQRALGVVDLDTYDSRAWLELGEVRLRRKEYERAAEAYVVAAILGFPSSAIGRHMAGRCFRHLERPFLAAYFFQAALETDPRAISPREELQVLPDAPVLTLLKDWSLDPREP